MDACKTICACILVECRLGNLSRGGRSVASSRPASRSNSRTSHAGRTKRTALDRNHVVHPYMPSLPSRRRGKYGEEDYNLELGGCACIPRILGRSPSPQRSPEIVAPLSQRMEFDDEDEEEFEYPSFRQPRMGRTSSPFARPWRRNYTDRSPEDGRFSGEDYTVFDGPASRPTRGCFDLS